MLVKITGIISAGEFLISYAKEVGEGLRLGYHSYKLRHKIIKLILKVAILAFLALVGIIAIGIIFAMNYQGQVYDAFQRIVNFIFGDNLVNVLRSYLKLIIDSVIKGLFSGG